MTCETRPGAIEQAKFGQPQIKLGIIPGAGGALLERRAPTLTHR